MITFEPAGIAPNSVALVAQQVEFFQTHYEIAANFPMKARGKSVFIGVQGHGCRFCGQNRPQATFGKEAHAVPELAGNGTLVSHYECDACNDRFSAFEDDLGKMTLLQRIAGQVMGKSGIPSAKTPRKLSRVDVESGGFKFSEYKEDAILTIDEAAKQMTLTMPSQPYRPLGAFKTLVKAAISVMNDADVAKVREAVRWLKERDLTTHQIDDGTRYTCIRSFTPGLGPIVPTRALLLRRKLHDAPCPLFVFVLAFGNLSFQVIVPAPQHDRHLIGMTVTQHAVPIFPLLVPDRVRGETKFWKADLSSPARAAGLSSVTFHFDRIEDVGTPSGKV
jgi:hypothetical protein